MPEEEQHLLEFIILIEIINHEEFSTSVVGGGAAISAGVKLSRCAGAVPLGDEDGCPLSESTGAESPDDEEDGIISGDDSDNIEDSGTILHYFLQQLLLEHP